MKIAALLLASIAGYILAPAAAVAAFRRQSPYQCMPFSNNTGWNAYEEIDWYGYGMRAAGAPASFKCPYHDNSLFTRESLKRVDVDVNDATQSDNVEVLACIQMFDVRGFGCGSVAATIDSFTGHFRLNPGLEEWTWPGNGNNYAYLYVVLSYEGGLSQWASSILGYYATDQTDGDVVSDSSWRIYAAGGAFPGGWETSTFNDSTWSNAAEQRVFGVAPWNSTVANFVTPTRARWIWNTKTVGSYITYFPGEPHYVVGAAEVLFRKKFTANKTSYTLKIATDSEYSLYVNGAYRGSGFNWREAGTYTLNVTPGEQVTVAVSTYRNDGKGGLVVDIR
jgi:hypothetical protein